MAQTIEQLQSSLTPFPDTQLGDGASVQDIKDAKAIWKQKNVDVLQKISQLQDGQRNSYGRQDDGSYKLNTDVTDEEAEEMAGRVAREQFERYMQRFAPQEEAILATQGDTVGQDAAQSSQENALRSRAALERMRQRYGVKLSGSQQQAESSNFQRNTTLGSLAARNMGIQMDEDRKYNLQGNMLNIGNNLQQSAQGGLTDSANNAAAREQAYQSAKAQHEASQWGILGFI